MRSDDDDVRYMRQALELARSATPIGEVPVAALLVRKGEVVAAAHNRRESWQDPTAHAELMVIQQAAAAVKSWRLTDSTLYVTLEPCTMCIGAVILARIPRLVFGATDPKAGACGSVLDIPRVSHLNHRVDVTAGVLAGESQALLQEFFQLLRKESVS